MKRLMLVLAMLLIGGSLEAQDAPGPTWEEVVGADLSLEPLGEIVRSPELDSMGWWTSNVQYVYAETDDWTNLYTGPTEDEDEDGFPDYWEDPGNYTSPGIEHRTYVIGYHGVEEFTLPSGVQCIHYRGSLSCLRPQEERP